MTDMPRDYLAAFSRIRRLAALPQKLPMRPVLPASAGHSLARRSIAPLSRGQGRIAQMVATTASGNVTKRMNIARPERPLGLFRPSAKNSGAVMATSSNNAPPRNFQLESSVSRSVDWRVTSIPPRSESGLRLSASSTTGTQTPKFYTIGSAFTPAHLSRSARPRPEMGSDTIRGSHTRQPTFSFIPVLTPPRVAAPLPPRLPVSLSLIGGTTGRAISPALPRTAVAPPVDITMAAPGLPKPDSKDGFQSARGVDATNIPDRTGQPSRSAIDRTEIHVDSHVLGQWVVNHLEQLLTQPPTTANFVMTRSQPTWPGQSPFI